MTTPTEPPGRTGKRVELARYSISGGERIIYGQLLITAGQHIQRLRGEGSFSTLCRLRAMRRRSPASMPSPTTAD